MSIEIEKDNFRRSRESREFGHEQKDKQEEGIGEAAALERADFLLKEVKTSKKQLQNIVLHMQQVAQAIQQLRQQLQLVQAQDDPASIKQDKKQIEELKKKIAIYADELEKMRGDLVREQMEELSRGEQSSVYSTGELQHKAEEMVAKLLEQIKD